MLLLVELRKIMSYRQHNYSQFKQKTNVLLTHKCDDTHIIMQQQK